MGGPPYILLPTIVEFGYLLKVTERQAYGIEYSIEARLKFGAILRNLEGNFCILP